MLEFNYNIMSLNKEAKSEWGPLLSALAMSSAEPSARYQHGAVGVGSNLFVWGGDGGGVSVVSSSVVERFNVRSASWREPRQLRDHSLPEDLSCMAVASDGDRAYCFGGRNSLGSQRYNALYVLDLSSMRCREIPGAASPTARSSSSMTHYERKLVLYGGMTEIGVSDELFVFDLDTSEEIAL